MKLNRQINYYNFKIQWSVRFRAVAVRRMRGKSWGWKTKEAADKSRLIRSGTAHFQTGGTVGKESKPPATNFCTYGLFRAPRIPNGAEACKLAAALVSRIVASVSHSPSKEEARVLNPIIIPPPPPFSLSLSLHTPTRRTACDVPGPR